MMFIKIQPLTVEMIQCTQYCCGWITVPL